MEQVFSRHCMNRTSHRSRDGPKPNEARINR